MLMAAVLIFIPNEIPAAGLETLTHPVDYLYMNKPAVDAFLESCNCSFLTGSSKHNLQLPNFFRFKILSFGMPPRQYEKLGIFFDPDA